MAKKFAIDVCGLVKKFGNHVAVNGIDLRVEGGTICGFLGPNGSGKTTTLRLICGLLRADGGGGTCLGYDIRCQSDEIHRSIGYMTQRFSFWEDLSVRENLIFTANVYAMDNAADRVESMLKSLGLNNRGRQLAGGLSGGWKQRLALAAGLIHEPKILLLDEPTAGVDPRARREFWETIHSLAAEGITILVSTHYMDEAERCHHIIFMHGGNVIARGSADEICAATGLKTIEVSKFGELTDGVLAKLGGISCAHFGNTLHISAMDEIEMRMALDRAFGRGNYAAREIATSLEDAFIHHTRGMEDGR
ncbi:MAG: ABC transporter ATP-binding protein [Puniceicoccales bacterium]|jgi:ABC-2 type transport system ATP-binding protein|nr:ABC transporter ATP-binding protein [Puniceicoccales bacterium]